MNPRQLLAALPFLLGAASLLPQAAQAQASVTGQWSKLQAVPEAPIQNILLPNGKVLMWGRGNVERLWDPITQSISAVPHAGYDLFCAGHAHLPDGRILVPGGHIADFVGLAKASIYNPATNSWSAVPDMNAGRWYPTVTTLPNGDALVVSGQIDTSVGVNPLPQVYQVATNSWRNLTGAQLAQGLYPMMFVAPNGKVIDVAPTHYTRWLDTTGTGSWSFVARRNFGWRDYGTAAMYADGKVLVAGGADPPTATAEVIDLNATTPVWRSVAPMTVARRHPNATILPDGTVLVTGGTSGPGHNNASTPVFAAELWNPATETWTRLASATVPRLYHASAFLLPDGRVVTNGGDGYTDTEVFSPPYLFKGARPTLSGVPPAVGYGQRFTVQSPDAAGIQKVTLIRLGAVTHAFDQNQRLNVLQFTRGSGALDITAPPNANLAPPGHYMLFAINGNGVPSVGGIVQLGGTAAPPPPPPPANFTLAVSRSGTAAGNGVVSSSPAGISCGANCSASFASGSSVSLSVSTSGGAVFAGWGGACSGTAPSCTVAMNAGKSVSATFNAPSSTCVPYPAWDPNKRYVGGEKVTRLGKYYIAKVVGSSVWNVNSAPEWTPQYWDPTTCP